MVHKVMNRFFKGKSAVPRVNHSLSMTTAVFLAALAAIIYLSRLVVIPLHEDVSYVIQATWNLLSDGNLRNSGLCYAFQTLRPDFHFTNPFFGHYLVAVFYYWPFFKLFGATDFAFFLGQGVLLALLGVLIAKSGMGWRWSVLTISASVLTGTLVGSIITSPTQLIAICFMAYFWFRLEIQRTSQPRVDGLLIGMGSYCRPEAVFMGVLSTAQNALKCLDSRKRIRFIGLTVAFALLSIFALDASLRLLGATSDYDSKLVLLMSDVLAPRFQVLGLSHFPPLSDLFHDPVLFSGFFHKVIHHLIRNFGPSSLIWGPTERVLVILPFLFTAARISSLRNYAPAFMLLIFQIVLNAMLIPLARHYDAAFFFLLCTLARDLKRWSEQLVSKSRMLFQTAVLIVSALVWAGPLGALKEGIQGGLRRRTLMLAASEQAHRRVPQDAFVITDMPELWLWYGRGKMCCFVPLNNPGTMRLVLNKFPQGYMVMFLGDGRAGYPLAQFQRPLLSSARHVMIYGPAPGN